MAEETWLLFPLWYIVFLLSVTCHEAGHAWAAWRGGDSTAYLGGQVSLNPLPHVRREPLGTILVPVLSFLYAHWMMGWASAPYDPEWEERHPGRAAWMAAAGPAANLALGAVGFFAIKAGVAAGIWYVPAHCSFDRVVLATGPDAARWDGVGRLLSILLSLNLLLFLFNLLPLPPLDGASVLAGPLPAFRRVRDALRSNPMSGLVGLVLAWTVFARIFTPIYARVLGWL